MPSKVERIESIDIALNRLTNLKDSEIESIDLQLDEVKFGSFFIKGLKMSKFSLIIILSFILIIFYFNSNISIRFFIKKTQSSILMS